MTRDELVVRVKQLLNKPITTAADDSGSPTNAEIIQCIEEERLNIYTELFDWLGDRAAASTTMTYTADSSSVALPTAAQDTKIIRVYFTGGVNNTSEADLNPIRLSEFSNVNSSGTPRYFAVTGTSIRLRPIPGSDTTLGVVYLPKLTALSASTSPTEIGSQWHHIYALGAAIAIRRKNEDPSSGLEKTYSQLYDKLVASVEMRLNDNHITLNDSDQFWSP